MEKHLGYDIPKLGFGMMRLPMFDENTIDIAQVEAMVDSYLKAGFTYFDTAYGYHGGRSEETVGRALVDRYPRGQFVLATKLPMWLLKEAGDMSRILETQLKRTGATYFDYYLMHSVSRRQLETADRLGTWDFMQRMKAEGTVRHIGLSFHDTADVLDEILTAHPEMEFVQLQINYADWDDENIQSRLCYETARKHNKPVIIMEPVKGGALAALGDDARAELEAVRPGMTPAAWALRFTGSLAGVITILSGMSTTTQMDENIETVSALEPLTDEDRAAIGRVKTILSAIPTTPCTDCKYCTEQCPKNIPIPAIIATDNGRRIYGNIDKGGYLFATKQRGRSSDCIQCGLCESRCPQNIKIMELLESCVAVYES